jgi:hypothetical protein
MSAKHTPGPWHIEEITPSDFHDCYILGAPNGVYDDIIATVQCTDLPQCMADARLIAAAPDLLAALQDIVQASDANNGDSLMNAIQAAEAAIAKATGQ